MTIDAKLNLDEVFIGGEWDTTIGEMVRDELKRAVHDEIRKAINNDPDVKKAIAKMKKLAASQLLESLGGKNV